MSRKKEHKIHIVTDDEVRQFGGATPGEAPASGEEAVDAAEAPATEPAPAAAPADELPALRRELEETKDKLLRARAETQNLLRRTAVEKSEAIRFANEAFVKALLPVVDDFERTLSAAGEAAGPDAIVEGVRLVYEKLLKVLKDHNVEPIEAAGKLFDPVFHSVMMQQPTAEHAPGTVLQEVQKGYCLRERVVRPAQVIIAGAPATGDDAEPS